MNIFLSILNLIVLTILLFQINIKEEDKVKTPIYSEIKGEFKVSYKRITEKTSSSYSWAADVLSANRIQYFPNYILITTDKEHTHLINTEYLLSFTVTQKNGTPKPQGK